MMNRSLPVIDLDNHGFWEAAKQGRLVVQYCPKTGRYQHPPRPYMEGCGFHWEWRDVAGTGTVYSYTVVYPPAHPALEPPYAAVLVQLDDANVRLVGLVRGVELDRLEVGMRVKVQFETVGDFAVPCFVHEGLTAKEPLSQQEDVNKPRD
jgi:uncharacterized OB-fold protein